MKTMYLMRLILGKNGTLHFDRILSDKLEISKGKDGTWQVKSDIDKGKDGVEQENPFSSEASENIQETTSEQDSEKTKQEEYLESVEIFFKKIAFLAERISSNARANSQSYSSQYNASGNVMTDVMSKLNLWG